MDPAPPRIPADLLGDAVAAVAADEVLVPGNAVMRRLLGDAGLGGRASVTLSDLPLPPAVVQALRAGDAVVAVAGTTPWSLRLVAHAGERWLLGRELGDHERAVAAEAAAARLRLLAGLAATVVHDLGNQLASALGLAEIVQPHLTDPVERRGAEDFSQGVRAAATLGKGLARLLATGPRRRAPVVVDDLVAETLAVVAKALQRSGVALVHERAATSARTTVHAVAAELGEAVLQIVLAVAATSTRQLTVRVAPATATIADGRERPAVLVDFAVDPTAEGRLRDLLPASRGPTTSGERLPFAAALAAVLRCGGDVVVVPTAPTLRLRLPTVVGV
jgi:hypothetical protein